MKGYITLDVLDVELVMHESGMRTWLKGWNPTVGRTPYLETGL